VIFKIYGHSNILGTHNNTIEFTKDSKLSKRGDCIIGIRADYDINDLLEIVSTSSKIRVVIRVADIIEEINCVINKEFNDEHEIVIRKSNFISKRTLGIRADKAAIDLSRELIKNLQNPKTRATVIIESI